MGLNRVAEAFDKTFLSVYFGSWEVAEHLSQLEKSQWLPRSKIEEIQGAKLRARVKHAYNHSGLYRRKLRLLGVDPSDIRSPSDLEKLPVITRRDLAAHGVEEVLSTGYSRKTLWSRSTSGSTGVPLTVYVDRRARMMRAAAVYRFASWYGYRPGVKCVRFYVPAVEKVPFRERIKDAVQRVLSLPTGILSESQLEEYASTLARFNPEVIQGSVTALYLLSLFLKRQGRSMEFISPRAVVSEQETLHASQRRTIESFFDTKVYNHYGSVEATSIAQECEEHVGLHVNAEDRMVEIMGDGEHVSPGEEGRVLVTDLENYVMPFIRYDIGDVATASDDECPCGRGLPLVENVEGRLMDSLVTKDGRLISGVFFALPAPYIIKDHRWIQQYQVVQESTERVVIKIVKSPRATAKEKDILSNSVRKFLGDVEVTVEFVDRIADMGTRWKPRFVVSKVAPDILSWPRTECAQNAEKRKPSPGVR